MAIDPPILLMDEPFGALDPITRLHLQDELLTIQRGLRKTVLIVTQDMDEAIRLGDRVSIDGLEGVVEELGLSYSRLRSDDGTSIEFPNALLAQKAIVSSTLRGGAIDTSAARGAR